MRAFAYCSQEEGKYKPYDLVVVDEQELTKSWL